MTTPFIIGIDLGTTNSAVAFVDTRRREGRVEQFLVPQLTEPSVVEPRPVLPSFLYFPETHEIESGATALPWSRSPDAIAGVLARERGALAPARQVASAKSWLAHPGIDRRAAILPCVDAPGPRISPVDASARYLMHIRDAWNVTMGPDEERLRLERQQIVLTVPASFDEEARELTVEAARQADFARVTLLEEPVATFYAWLSDHRENAFEDGQVALVCDVGGGTTDFSLIRVRLDGGWPVFERIAIGDHLLLGGDNVDLALAALVERRVVDARPGVRLAITQRAALRRQCAAAKERMLGDAPPERVAVTILGAGRSVVGEAVSADLTQEDVRQVLDDFLPIAAPGEIAAARDRRAGLRELGLPYEADPAVTRHLGSFLARSTIPMADAPSMVDVDGRRMVRPDLVLFGGGFFMPAAARDRVEETLATWFGDRPRVLATRNLEAAVARGAATYGRLRAGIGPSLALIKAGSARAYYIGLRAPGVPDSMSSEVGARDGGRPAVCVLERGTEEGTETRLDHPFTVATNQPISFALYSSTLRADHVGNIVSVDSDPDAHEHAPLVTVLRYGRKSRRVDLPVRLMASFTEVGTLELWCESRTTDHRWRLQFQLRNADADVSSGANAAESTETSASIPDEVVSAAERTIRAVFENTGAAGSVSCENLVAWLEQTLGYGKIAWPLPVIRRFADVLIDVADARHVSPPIESRWLNLFGFCLRPGFGAAKDPWRIGEARKVYAVGIAFPHAIQNRVEWLVLWQRASGGFSAGQQQELAQRVMGDIGLAGKRGGRCGPQIERESWRLLASLERLDARTRVRIGDELMARLRRNPDSSSLAWSIGRLGARSPLYGTLSSIVPPQDAGRWLEALIALKRMSPDLVAAIVQIAARTGDPLRDLGRAVVDRARERLQTGGVAIEAMAALDEVVPASTTDFNRVFGEPLPDGLRLELQDCRIAGLQD